MSNPIEVYTYLLTEINKLGNEEVMRSMLNKYMLDPKDDRFIVQLGVCLLTEIRQHLDKLVDWDDDPEVVEAEIHKKYQRWNAEEIRNADVIVKTSHEVKEEREQREKNKAKKDVQIAEENKKRKAARKAKKDPIVTLDTSKSTKVIGNIGGYALESVK
jgi:hypothetical protein